MSVNLLEPKPGFMGIQPRLDELLDKYQSGFTLDKSFYTSDWSRALDEQLFSRHWFYAATVCDIPFEGDCLIIEVMRESIILVRNLDGEIRAFFNVCCHRGSQVLCSKQGSCANLVCHYHHWTYNLDGQLVHAGNMGENFDLGQYQLKQVQVRVIHGQIFLHLGEGDDSIEKVAALADVYLKPYDFSRLKVAYVEEEVRAANWKLVMENNRECYHCHGNHPELVMSIMAEGFGNSMESDELQQIMHRKQNEWQNLGLAYETQDFPDDLWIRLARLPLANSALSQTLDGTAACTRLIAGFDYPESSELSVWTYPNSWHHYLNDHVVSFSVLPIDQFRSCVRTVWLVDEEAEEGKDYSLEHLTNVWKQTNQQDARLFESVMQGMNSSKYQPGPLAQEEKFVQNFLDWYVNQARMVVL